MFSPILNHSTFPHWKLKINSIFNRCLFYISYYIAKIPGQVIIGSLDTFGRGNALIKVYQKRKMIREISSSFIGYVATVISKLIDSN